MHVTFLFSYIFFDSPQSSQTRTDVKFSPDICLWLKFVIMCLEDNRHTSFWIAYHYFVNREFVTQIFCRFKARLYRLIWKCSSPAINVNETLQLHFLHYKACVASVAKNQFSRFKHVRKRLESKVLYICNCSDWKKNSRNQWNFHSVTRFNFINWVFVFTIIYLHYWKTTI